LIEYNPQRIKSVGSLLTDTFPEGNREEKVFKMNVPRGGSAYTRQGVGEVVSEIGKKANVVVNKQEGKFASCHDLRRSFATRWAPRVKPATLPLLMRHADIATALRFYMAQDAEEVADELWRNYNSFYNTHSKKEETESKTNSAKP
jgi:integrase